MRIIRILLSRINKMWLLLGVAILLGLAATWVTTQYLKTREARIEAEARKRAVGGSTVAVVVPLKNLPRGTAVDASVMAARDVLADTVYEETVLASDFGKVQGMKLARPVEQGRPLRRSDLESKTKEFSQTLPEGQRAMTIDVDELNSVAQMVRVGNRVDLMLVVTDANDPTGGQQVVSLLQRVKVIATGQTITRSLAVEGATTSAPQQRYSNITVEVTPEEAARIILAQQMGRIRAVLRNEDDQVIAPLGRVNTQMLMRGGSIKKRERDEDEPPIVEFIIGGKGSGGAGQPQNITVNMPSMPGMVPPAVPGAGAPGAGTAQISIPGIGNVPYPAPYGAGSPAALSASGATKP
jgi:pilus assembly protein CpaB